jgi:hypothetical protein
LKISREKVSKNNQMVGNIGLFYTCYRLSKLGWNAMPTSRNARGIDIIMYGQDGIKKHTVHVKSLTKRSPVPLGSNLESLFADYLIICRNVFDNPEMFVTTPKDVYKKYTKVRRKDELVTGFSQRITKCLKIIGI